MAKDIVEWARTYLPCQQSKTSKHVHSEVQHISVPSARFRHVHIDIVGPLTPAEGYNYCLTVIDRLFEVVGSHPFKNYDSG